MNAQDLLLDDTGDLAVVNGDLVLGPADAQHISLLLRSSQGDWRQDPLAGIGLPRYLLGPYGPTQAAALSRATAIQLERDGYQVLEVDVADIRRAIINAERP